MNIFLISILPSWQVDRVYLSSPNIIAVLDHEKKRTFVIRKEGLPDVGKLYELQFFSTNKIQTWIRFQVVENLIAILFILTFMVFSAVWNPWEKKSKSMVDFGDEEYKQMLCVDGAVIEKPVSLKPGEEWTGRLQLSVVPSSFCSDRLGLDRSGL